MCSALATCDETVSISPNRASRPGSDLQTAAPLFAHLYVDGFFASVERSLRPKFRTRPVFVVTSSKSGSADAPTILSTSYEAKLLGVSVGISLEDALAVCPQAAVVPCRFSLYAEYAESVRAILDGFSSAVQPDSTDGFYIDLSGVADTRSLDGDFSGTLRRLQLEILKRTGLSASIGAAKTRVAAAVASRLERPRGLRIVAAGTEAAWLATLPVEALHGINQIDANNLRKRGVRSIAELRRVPLASLEGIYGQSTGRQIWENSRSLDQTVPKSKPAAPSLTREFTFDPASASVGAGNFHAVCEYLSTRLSFALAYAHSEARTVSLRIRYADQFSASQSLRLSDFPSLPSADPASLVIHCQNLLRSLLTRPIAVQSIAVSVATISAASNSSPALESILAATA